MFVISSFDRLEWVSQDLELDGTNTKFVDLNTNGMQNRYYKG